MNLLIASNNPGKVREIKAMLSNSFKNIFTLNDLDIDTDPDETGSTFIENALIKARAILAAVRSASPAQNIAVLADDSGLCVDYLDGAPGVFSARYAGQNASMPQNIAKLLANLANADTMSARFVCQIVLLYPDGNYLSAVGETFGEITNDARGANGFGYDPHFFSYDLKKTFAEASDEEKNAVSHRGRALDALLKLLYGC